MTSVVLFPLLLRETSQSLAEALGSRKGVVVYDPILWALRARSAGPVNAGRLQFVIVPNENSVTESGGLSDEQ
jgi:hypothetical protein